MKQMRIEKNYFIDTSALFKRYILGTGTEELDGLFKSAGGIYISNLTVVEVISSLKRLLEIDKLIDMKIYKAIKGCFLEDVAKNTLRLEAILPKTVILAVEMIDEKYITTIDALQLASAVQLDGKIGSLSFVCSDKKLIAAARNKGLNVVEI